VLSSTIQHVGGVGRPFGLAQVARFPLIKIAAEVVSEIRTGARRRNVAARARRALAAGNARYADYPPG